MRVEAAQVIDRPPADVFRFEATDHFQNHPLPDPAVEKMPFRQPCRSPSASGTGAGWRSAGTELPSEHRGGQGSSLPVSAAATH
jgi:hypothetical protein